MNDFIKPLLALKPLEPTRVKDIGLSEPSPRKRMLLFVVCGLAVFAFMLCSFSPRSLAGPLRVPPMNGACGRALWEMTLQRTGDFLPYINQNGGMVTNGRRRFPQLTAFHHPDLDSVAITTWSGETPPAGIETYIHFLPGTSASYSHLGTVLEPLWIFADPSPPKKSLTARIRESGLYAPVIAGANDLPFHGGGSYDPKFHELQTFVDAQARYFEAIKAHGVNIVVVARSGSALAVLELAKKYPGLISKIILVSPPHFDPRHFESMRNKILELEKKGHVQLNREGFAWAQNMRPQLSLWDSTHHVGSLGETPLYFIFGEEDPEIDAALRTQILEAAGATPFEGDANGSERSSSVPRVFSVNPGLHDQLAIRDPQNAVRVYQNIYRFLDLPR